MLLLLSTVGCVTVTGPAQQTQPGATPDPNATAPPVAAPETAWDVELRDVSPDGERSLESALQLFSMAYGPLPGVEGVTESPPLPEGTLAMRAILAHYDELTAEQQAAVDEWLAPDPDAVVVEVGPVGTGYVAMVGPMVAQPNLTPIQQAVLNATRDYRAAIAAKMGGDMPGTISLSFPTKQRPDALADADGVYENGALTQCNIRWFPSGLADAALNILLTAAHETFHCFQASAFTSRDRYINGADWWQEGGAEWVSYDVAGAPQDGGFWDDYVNLPELSLFQRTYDGVGFWADLAATGISPWPKWRAIWDGYENEAAWVASGAEDETFLNSWSSGWFREPDRGGAWDMTGPGIPPGNGTPDPLTIGNGVNASVSAGPYTNKQYYANSSADVMFITGTGRIRISDRSVDEPLAIGGRYCTKPGGCVCPDGKPLPFPLTNLATFFAVAVTGGSSSSSGNLTGMSIDDFCNPEEESEAVMVKVDRPARDGVLPGTVVDLLSCDGPYGTWRGVFRTGGLSNQGFEVPWTDLPVEFTMPAEGGVQTATTTTGGTVPTPIGPIDLDYVVTVTVTGGTMTIVLVPGVEGMDNQLVDIPIQPAPEGACPE